MSEIEAELAAYVPHPGSRLDRVSNAATQEQPVIHDAPAAGADTFVVQTHSHMPEETIPRTIQLSSTNPYLPILPRDMHRRRAVLIATVNPVILCETKELAQQVATQIASGASPTSLNMGAYAPAGAVVQLESRDWLYAAATTYTSTTTANGGVSTTAEGTAGTPSAGTTIAATSTLAPGNYAVTTYELLTGTATASDAANMQLLVGSTVIGTLVYPGTSESTMPANGPFVVTVPSGGATISVKTIGAGSGTANYYAQIIATPVAGTSAVASVSPVTVVVERYANSAT